MDAKVIVVGPIGYRPNRGCLHHHHPSVAPWIGLGMGWKSPGGVRYGTPYATRQYQLESGLLLKSVLSHPSPQILIVTLRKDSSTNHMN